jgi:uncharacterized membrane protein
MSWNEFWLFLHLSATIVWIGGAVAVQIFAALTKRAADPALSAAFGRNVAFFASRVFFPSSLVVLATGIFLTENGNWHWSEPFIVFGLVGWAVVAATAFGYVGRAMASVGRRMATEGPSPALLAEVNRIVLLARVLILILFAIVFMMVTKLGT